ncbi:MAG: Yip1 family protein [Myxococcota bacterium]
MREASCAHHPTVPMQASCGRCGDFLCHACLEQARGVPPVCVLCQQRGVFIPGETPLPWESGTRTLRGFWATVVLSWSQPRTLFRRIDPAGGWWSAQLYLLGCEVGALLGGAALVGVLLRAALQPNPTEPVAQALRMAWDVLWLDLAQQQVGLLGLLAFGMGVGALVMMQAVTVAYAVVLHTALRIVGADREGFRATWRLCCYSAGVYILAGLAACWIAFLGAGHRWAVLMMLSMAMAAGAGLAVYTVVLTSVGLQGVHRLSVGQILGALPVAFMVALFGGVVCYLWVVVPIAFVVIDTP